MRRAVKINQETVQAMLPSIPQDFEREMREMIARMPAQRKERPVMKKKISAGLVFALILLLITVSAVAAALLGGKDFVDQIMAPKAAENKKEDRYTSAEVTEILALARENGIELPDYIIARLGANEDGEYKEELMRQFVKTEYGFYPSAWPLEVQHWYEVTMEACGQGDGHIANVLPGERELSQEQALAIVEKHIRDTYGETKELNNVQIYRRHMQYKETIVNPYLTERKWDFEYEAYAPEDNIYHVTLSAEGEILSTQKIPGIYASSEEMSPYSITNRFAWAYEDGYGGVQWTNERLIAYQNALQYRVNREGEAGITDNERHILKQVYLLPDDVVLSQKEAIAKAVQACEGFEIYPGYENFTLAVCLDTAEGPAWKVKLTLKRGENRMGRAYIEVDACNGEVKACDTSFESSPEWRGIVSEGYWAENRPAPKDTEKASASSNRPTFRPDGKPGVWYSEIAPDWYWEKLDAVGYSSETASDLWNTWEHAYGVEIRFWPLEAQAIHYLWYEIYSHDVKSIPGLPSDTDVSRELAEKLAKSAFERQYSEALGETDIDLNRAVCGVSYWFNQPYDGVNVWEITLFTDKGHAFGTVQINAQTGEAEMLSNSWEKDVILVHEPTPAPTPTPRPDGKPWNWGSDVFTPAYWAQLEKAMEEEGVSFENADEKFAQWDEAYRQNLEGTDRFHFWPQKQKAIYFAVRLLDQFVDQQAIILPVENGISYEQALEIARQEAQRLCPEDEAWVNRLGISACLWSDNWRNPGKPTWVIQLHEMGGEFNTRIWISLDGETGKILFSELDLKGNG